MPILKYNKLIIFSYDNIFHAFAQANGSGKN